ncbi:macro domain-containing protein [Nonomuraea sp. NPDC050783]|uniref:macro domain-containing protein n=1 Tax=Nonomuraea sp. NPDC050783 TaxID=3154634 RepID=UPI0034669E93
MTARLEQVLRTPRGRARLAARFFPAFGVVSVVLVPVLASGVPMAGLWVALAVLGCLVWALVLARPRDRIARRLPGATVVVRLGDLLAEEADLVVGCGDTFDLDLSPDLLGPAREGGRDRLAEELDLALAGRVPTSVAAREAKPEGRLRRYPIGTVAVLGGGPRRRVYCLACVRTGGEASMDDLWTALGRLWASVRESERVAVPLLGSELGLGGGSLVKLIVLSFAVQAEVWPVCRELVVVVPPEEAGPGEAGKVDLLELEGFLASL